MTDTAEQTAGEYRLAPGWRDLRVSLALAFGVLSVAFWPTFAAILHTWMNSATYTHGFLIVPIAGYLIWLRRDELARIPPQLSYWGMACTALFSLAWLAGYAVDVAVVQQFAAVALIPALTWAMLGSAAVRAMAFPLAFLLFAVPAGDSLVPVLQDYTAAFSVKALQLSNIPVFQEGRYISIPAGDFEVARACSGVRYLIASLSLGCLYAYLSYHTWWRRLLFVALAVVVPIVANGIRAYGIIMIGHLSDMKLAAGVDHIIYGWVFFGVVMALLFWIGSLFREPMPEKRAVSVSTTFKPLKRGMLVSWSTAAVMVVGIGPVGAFLMAQGASGTETVVLQPPAGQDGWSGPTVPTDNWKPIFHGSAQEIFQMYQKHGHAVYVYVAYYPQQRQGAELINSQNRLFDDETWRRTDESLHAVTLPNGRQWEVHSTAMAFRDTTRVAWHWYDIGGQTTVQPLQAKLLEARARLFGNQRGAMVTVIATDYEIDRAEAQMRLEDFLGAMLPSLQAMPESGS